MNTYILQIETATQICAVALSCNGETITSKVVDEANIHANKLTLFITEIMTSAGLQFTDLKAIAISKGPGSYTGLRIGVSTAKGICFALGIPLIAVDTLQNMALGVAQNHTWICPMIDARRMEVYTCIFDEKGQIIRPTEAKIIDENSFLEELAAHKMLFIGNGAEKCKALIAHPNAIFSTENYNDAAHMTALVYEKYKAGMFEDLAYFEPFYLKEFVSTVSKKNIF